MQFAVGCAIYGSTLMRFNTTGGTLTVATAVFCLIAFPILVLVGYAPPSGSDWRAPAPVINGVVITSFFVACSLVVGTVSHLRKRRIDIP